MKLARHASPIALVLAAFATLHWACSRDSDDGADTTADAADSGPGLDDAGEFDPSDGPTVDDVWPWSDIAGTICAIGNPRDGTPWSPSADSYWQRYHDQCTGIVGCVQMPGFCWETACFTCLDGYCLEISADEGHACPDGTDLFGPQ